MWCPVHRLVFPMSSWSFGQNDRCWWFADRVTRGSRDGRWVRNLDDLGFGVWRSSHNCCLYSCNKPPAVVLWPQQLMTYKANSCEVIYPWQYGHVFRQKSVSRHDTDGDCHKIIYLLCVPFQSHNWWFLASS